MQYILHTVYSIFYIFYICIFCIFCIFCIKNSVYSARCCPGFCVLFTSLKIVPPCPPLSFASRAPFMLILLLCLSSSFVVDILYLMAATDLAILSYDRQSVLCMFHALTRLMCAIQCQSLWCYIILYYGGVLWWCSMVSFYCAVIWWCSVLVIYVGAL